MNLTFSYFFIRVHDAQLFHTFIYEPVEGGGVQCFKEKFRITSEKTRIAIYAFMMYIFSYLLWTIVGGGGEGKQC